MANLKKEYSDINDNKHKVEHLTIFDKDGNNKEQIVEELTRVLTRPGKRTPA